MTPAIKRYFNKRIAEWSSRIGIALTLAPSILELSKEWTMAIVVIGIVLFGVPEDKFRR